MIFENFFWSFIGIWLYNKLIEAFVYSNYNDFASVELMRIEILKLTLILPVIALLSELYVFIKNHNSKVFHHRKLKEQKLKIEDIKQEKSLILINGLFIFFILLFYITQKPEESGQFTFYFLLLNFIVIELYFVINSFNNIITRNGIYQNGIFFMGKSYPWHKIDDIQLKKHNREILLIKKLPGIGNIKTKISYSKDQVEEYVEKMTR
jgi:hypothetical protein